MRTGIASFAMIARTRRHAVTTPSLTDQQLAKLLELIKGSDTVALKLTVPDTDIGSVPQAPKLDLLDGQIRQIVFFDSLDLTLNRSGVVVRARRIQGGRGDTVVKLPPVLPDQISRQMRTSPGFGVEVDAMPGGVVSSASMKESTTGGGSSQFTFGRGSHVDERFSVNVGAVRYTERFHLDAVVSPEVLGHALEVISDDLAVIDDRPSPEAVVAMGGCRHQHDGGETGSRHVRPGRRPRNHPR